MTGSREQWWPRSPTAPARRPHTGQTPIRIRPEGGFLYVGMAAATASALFRAIPRFHGAHAT
jgi:hypothetical protein